MYEHMPCSIFRQLRYCSHSFKLFLLNKYDCGICFYWRCMCFCVCRFLLWKFKTYEIVSPKAVSSNRKHNLIIRFVLLFGGQQFARTAVRLTAFILFSYTRLFVVAFWIFWVHVKQSEPYPHFDTQSVFLTTFFYPVVVFGFILYCKCKEIWDLWKNTLI